MTDEHDAIVAAALSFLDEFVPATTAVDEGAWTTEDGNALYDDHEPSSPDPIAKTETLLDLASSPELVASHPVSLKKRSLRRDSNRARKLARHELMQLRAQAAVLSKELAHLRAAVQHRGASHSATTIEAEGAAERTTANRQIGRKLWQTTARRQLEQRVRSSLENRRLRALLDAQRHIATELQRLVQSRATVEAAEACGLVQCMQTPALDLSVAGVLQSLLQSVDAAYTRVDNLLSEPNDNVHVIEVENGERASALVQSNMMMVARKVVPFDGSSVANAAWRHYTQVCRPSGTCLFSHGDIDGANTDPNTVMRFFGMKTTLHGASAEFLVKQIMRRYTEANRDVILWESIVEPITFSGKFAKEPVREQGYVVISSLPSDGETPTAEMQTYYSVTSPSHGGCGKRPTDELATFVSQWMADVIVFNYHRIENIVFDEQLQLKKLGWKVE